MQGVCGDASEDVGEDIGMAASLTGGTRGGGRRQGRQDDNADVVDKIDELCSGVNVMYGEKEARVYGQGWSVHSVGQELRRH